MGLNSLFLNYWPASYIISVVGISTLWSLIFQQKSHQERLILDIHSRNVKFQEFPLLEHKKKDTELLSPLMEVSCPQGRGTTGPRTSMGQRLLQNNHIGNILLKLAQILL